MRRIAIINQKGGAGKTTTAVNVADALARSGWRVLLIDLDPQSHATLHVGVQLKPDERSIYDVLVRGEVPPGTLRDISDRLVLLPASIDLVGAEVELREIENRELRLAEALTPYRQAFDACVIDCPPSLGELTLNALAAVREVIIPLQPHFLALQGLGRLLETVTLVRQVVNPELRVSGVAMCMFETGTRLAQEVLADVRQFVAAAEPDDAWYGARVFDTPIRRNIKLAECPSFGQTIYDYAPSSHGAADYLALTQELIAMDGAGPTAAPVTKPIDEVVPLPSEPLGRVDTSPAVADDSPVPTPTEMRGTEQT